MTGRRTSPPDRQADRAGRLANSGPSPSAIVRREKTASRSFVCGSSAIIAVWTAAKTSPASVFKLTAVALANKLARIVYATLRSGGTYDDLPVAAPLKEAPHDCS